MRRQRIHLSVALIVVAAAAVASISATSAGAASHQTTTRTFRGNGGKTLAPFSVRKASTLYWSATGGVFQIFPAGAESHGSVNSQGSSGWTYLPSGRYSLKVNAIGNWTIRVVARTVAPKRLKGGWLSYSGNGGMELPPFRLPRSEQVKWQAKGGIFQIFSDGFTGIEVNSQASKGTTYATKGTQKLQINALGHWTIAWRR